MVNGDLRPSFQWLTSEEKEIIDAWKNLVVRFLLGPNISLLHKNEILDMSVGFPFGSRAPAVFLNFHAT